MPELVSGVFLIVGSLFLLLAGLALLRMPDLYTRISASSKAVTAGAGACFIAGGVAFMDAGVATRAIAGLAFFMLTSPVSAHVVARAAAYLHVPFVERTELPPREAESGSPLRMSQ